MNEKDMILEAGKKRFQQIMEYTIIGNSAAEEADDDQAQDAGGAPAGGADPMAGGNPMGGDPAGGADPMAGGDPMGGGDPSAAGADPMMGGDPSAAGGDTQGPEGFNPQGGDAAGADTMDGGMDASMDPSMGGDTPGGDDDVVDITALTDKQDEIADDIKHQDARVDKALEDIGEFKEIVRRSNEKLNSIVDMFNDMKAEFEKRNPTQVEKLGLQTTRSYPFSETVPDYWAKKEKESNYSTEPDNNGVGQGQYVITKDDVNGDTNWKAIHDSLDDGDFLNGLTLDKLTKF